MTDYKRTLELERAHVNTETGEFTTVLFTSGEASDGHILDVRGAELPNDMPLFVGHYADPIDQLGTLFPAERTDTAIHYRGRIETSGEGASADIRRDLLLKMANGHVKRMSGRWDADAENVRRRVDLPSDHFAHVAKDAPNPQRSGSLFETWRAVEGSIVGLGADPAATMRWARDAEAPAVRDFWNTHAREQAVESFKLATGSLIEAGMTAPEIIESIEQAYKIERVDSDVIARLGSIEDLIADIGERSAEREEPKPQETERKLAASLPALTIEQVTRVLGSTLEASEERVAAMVDTKIATARGKVLR